MHMMLMMCFDVLQLASRQLMPKTFREAQWLNESHSTDHTTNYSQLPACPRTWHDRYHSLPVVHTPSYYTGVGEQPGLPCDLASTAAMPASGATVEGCV